MSVVVIIMRVEFQNTKKVEVCKIGNKWDYFLKYYMVEKTFTGSKLINDQYILYPK